MLCCAPRLPDVDWLQFCCSVATWFCWGNTHFCEECHKRQCAGDYLTRKPVSKLSKCKGKASCALGVDHPANGTEYSLGCTLCRTEAAARPRC